MAEEDVDKFDMETESPSSSPRHSPHHLSGHKSLEENAHQQKELTNHVPQHVHFNSSAQSSLGDLGNHPPEQLVKSSNVEESIQHSLGEPTIHLSPHVRLPELSNDEDSIQLSLGESTSLNLVLEHSTKELSPHPYHIIPNLQITEHTSLESSYQPESSHGSSKHSSKDSESADLSSHQPSQHFRSDPPLEPPNLSLTRRPQPQILSPLNVLHHTFVNMQASTSHGGHEDEGVAFYAPQWSIRDTVLSTLSDMANAALDFILPPLPPEPSPTIVESTRKNDRHPTNDSQVSHRSHVAFSSVHDERSISTSSVQDVTHEAMPRKGTAFRQRGLSERFYQKPIYPAQKKHTLKETFFIAYQTLGVVFGDLGTSPLYVYPTINVKNPTEEDFLGILSLIFWTLTLIGVFKYSLIVLQADDHGEGGTFALYSLLCQHANIGQHQGEERPYKDVEGRRLSHMYKLEEQPKYSRTKEFLESNRKAQQILLFVVMMGTCMIIGDGILTPAISVISAIEGIQIASPKLGKAVIVAISAIILILLFFLQKYGTHLVSLFFSPVMAIWFLTTPMVGIYNIIVHYPKVFKAFSPAYIVYFFQAKGKEAWLMLGGTVLCITGAEAMYADMGHFNKRSIQIAFCLVVYPSVMLTYTGQTAYLIKHPQDHSQGFFKMIPQKLFWPMFVVSTLAAIVASQGLISATFSIIKQSVALDYFPRVKLVHTSEHKEGQIYSPEVNYILMVLCLAVVFGFRSSATIGVAVTFVMLITTFLMALVMLVIWGCRVVVVICFFSLFFLVETVYISSVVIKVPQGGWLPFAVALVVTLIMFTWNMGCQAKYQYELKNQITKHDFDVLLREVGSVRVPGICFFYTDLMSGVPPIVQHYVTNVRSFHRVLVFTTVRFLPVKTVLPSERFLVGRAGFDGVYRCVARYGYRDVMKIQNNEFLDQFLTTLKEYIESATNSTGSRRMMLDDELFPHLSSANETSMLNNAREDGAVYVMGKGELKVSKTTKFTTRIFVGTIYKFLRSNCRSEVSAMDIPYANYLEIGMLYHI